MRNVCEYEWKWQVGSVVVLYLSIIRLAHTHTHTHTHTHRGLLLVGDDYMRHRDHAHVYCSSRLSRAKHDSREYFAAKPDQAVLEYSDLSTLFSPCSQCRQQLQCRILPLPRLTGIFFKMYVFSGVFSYFSVRNYCRHRDTRSWQLHTYWPGRIYVSVPWVNHDERSVPTCCWKWPTKQTMVQQFDESKLVSIYIQSTSAVISGRAIRRRVKSKETVGNSWTVLKDPYLPITAKIRNKMWFFFPIFLSLIVSASRRMLP